MRKEFRDQVRCFSLLPFMVVKVSTQEFSVDHWGKNRTMTDSPLPQKEKFGVSIDLYKTHREKAGQEETIF
jgi:hypothetical protein